MFVFLILMPFPNFSLEKAPLPDSLHKHGMGFILCSRNGHMPLALAHQQILSCSSQWLFRSDRGLNEPVRVRLRTCVVTSEVKYWPPSCQLREEPVGQGNRHRGEQNQELDKTRAARPVHLTFQSFLVCWFVYFLFKPIGVGFLSLTHGRVLPDIVIKQDQIL